AVAASPIASRSCTRMCCDCYRNARARCRSSRRRRKHHHHHHHYHYHRYPSRNAKCGRSPKAARGLSPHTFTPTSKKLLSKTVNRAATDTVPGFMRVSATCAVSTGHLSKRQTTTAPWGELSAIFTALQTLIPGK